MPWQAVSQLTQLPCVPCNGRGYNSCGGCYGIGHTFVSRSRLRFDGRLEFYQDRLPCIGCSGKGHVMCLSCKGVGWTLHR